MNCPKCYANIPDGASYCPNCGELIQQYGQDNTNQNSVFCSNCRTPNNTFVTNCMRCGYPLQQKIQPNSQTKHKKSIFKRKWFVLTASSLCAIIIAVSIILVCFSSSKSNQSINNNFYIRFGIPGEYKIADSTGKILYEPGEEGDIFASPNGKHLTCIDEDEDEIGTLFLLSDGKSIEIAEDAKKVYHISNDGKYLFYLNSDGELYQYNVSKKEKYLIDIDEEDLKYSHLTFSPNGKYVAYCIISNLDLKIEDAVVFSEGNYNTVSLEKFVPISITNDGKSMYGYSLKSPTYSGYTLYSIVDDEPIEISSNVFRTYINSDSTQIMYESNNRTYLSENFKEGVILGNGFFMPIVPESNRYTSNTAVRITDFKDCFYVNENDVNKNDSFYYLGSDLTVTKIASVDYDTMDDSISFTHYKTNGSLLYYIKNDDLYKVAKDDLETPERIARDVEKFWFTDNGKYVYFIDEEETLYAITKNGKEELAEDIDEAAIDSSGNFFYISDSYQDTGDLYYCKGTKSEKIESDVQDVYSYCGKIIYEYDYDKYGFNGEGTFSAKIQTSGKNFEILGEEIFDIDLI